MTVIGIDGGGTRTRAILVNENGRVLGKGEAGPSNYHNVGAPAAAANLLEATRAAWRQAGQPFQPAAVAFLGLAGIKTAGDISRMKTVAEATGIAPVGAITIENDLFNALAGGLDGAPGIALIAGTGANCLGRDRRGKTCSCGGWGWLLGDRGAGFGLGAEALRAVCRAVEGRGPATRLSEAALQFYQLSEPGEFLAHFSADQWQPGLVGAFAPRVIQLAADHDAVALSVLQAGADDLAGLVAATMDRLTFSDNPDVVLLGGCLSATYVYRPLVETAIRRKCPNARLRPARYEPLHGAALNALQLIHSPDDRVTIQLSDTDKIQ